MHFGFGNLALTYFDQFLSKNLSLICIFDLLILCVLLFFQHILKSIKFLSEFGILLSPSACEINLVQPKDYK